MFRSMHYPRGLRLFMMVCITCSFASCVTDVRKIRLEELNKVVEISKGPCYGRCPVFTLTIYQDGIASYQGERFTDRVGLYVKRLDKEVFANLEKEFRDANLWQYQNVYKSRIADLQSVTLTYYEEGDIKAITGKEGRPQAVLKLEQTLDRIAAGADWILKEGPPPADLPEDAIPNELVVQLNSGVNAYAWTEKYAKQGMKVLKSLSTDGYHWLISFDASIVPPKDMIELVRKDSEAVGAEFNRKGAN